MVTSDGTTISVDFTREVLEWDYDYIDNIDTGDTEILNYQTLLAEIDQDIEAAKQKEMQAWIDQEVYDEVNDEGQKCISVRWVISPKVIDGVT